MLTKTQKKKKTKVLKRQREAHLRAILLEEQNQTTQRTFLMTSPLANLNEDELKSFTPEERVTRLTQLRENLLEDPKSITDEELKNALFLLQFDRAEEKKTTRSPRPPKTKTELTESDIYDILSIV